MLIKSQNEFFLGKNMEIMINVKELPLLKTALNILFNLFNTDFLTSLKNLILNPTIFFFQNKKIFIFQYD